LAETKLEETLRDNYMADDVTSKEIVPYAGIGHEGDWSQIDVTQTGNRIGRDLAGRDIVTTNVYNSKRSQISYLNEKYKEECQNQTEVCEYIKGLLHYTDRGDEPIKGLDHKLKQVNRDAQYIEFATRQKELFAKRLLKRDLSPAAQRIFAYMMGKIKLNFIHNIIPRIKAGATEAEIDGLICSSVLEPAVTELEENVLDFTVDEIEGMLFYLTGNCHISWNGLC
jgi:hypothetical protein